MQAGRVASGLIVLGLMGTFAVGAGPAGAQSAGAQAAGAQAAGAQAAGAQTAPMVLPRLEGRIEVDGVLDDTAWMRVPPLPLTMYFPTFRGQPAQRSEIRVAYDDDFLYAAGWFHDDNPGGIRINSLYRDRWNGDDAFAIYVDAFNDNQNSKWFGTTPGGIRFDLLVSDDGATLNESWDAVWDARTTVTADGWFAEVRIPFSTLGFQATEGTAIMGLTVTRLVSRTGERVTFPAIDPQFEFRQPSRAMDVVLEGVQSNTPLHLTPYLLAGATRAAVLETGAPAFTADRNEPAEIGLDLRYAVAGNLTLDLSANTDFAQVEADDQQVNLDRFSLFFPEKRRFFQERSGIFEFTTGEDGRLFHSRRIGLTPDRRPLPVMAGARLVGRVGEWDLGILSMQTESIGDAAGENFGVARVRRRVFDSFSLVGAMLTTRVGGSEHNIAAGADALLRLFGDDYLTAKWAASGQSGEGRDVGFLDRSQFFLQWQRRAQRGLAYSATMSRSGTAYDPGVGFIARSNYTAFNTYGNYYIYTDEHPVWRRIFPGYVVEGTYRNAGGTLESGRIATWIRAETKGGSVAWIEPQLFREDVLQPFSIAGQVDVPPGGYTFANLWLYWQMPAGRRLRLTSDLQAGTFFDGRRIQLVLSPTWNASPRLELGGRYTGNFLRFDERGQAASIHLSAFRVRTALDARASANALVQYNSATDRLELNVRLRYNFAEGTDLWIVYDEGLATDREPDPLTPRLPLSVSRAFILKYTHTLTF